MKICGGQVRGKLCLKQTEKCLNYVLHYLLWNIKYVPADKIVIVASPVLYRSL